MSASPHVVVIGAGHAGGSAAAALRQGGWEGRITLIGEEPELPYQRPPLSKGWLKGEESAESLALRSAKFYGEQQIDVRISTVATAIDPAGQTVCLASGERLAYDFLILATGSRNRPLPVEGPDLPGILELRTAAHANALQSALRPGKRLAVVGGGFIGLEVAASARKLGLEVAVIEREPRLLSRVVCAEVSAYFDRRHREEGVTLLLDTAVSGFASQNGHVSAVTLADGQEIPCDIALVGIGALPNQELAAAAGLECANGVVVDDSARTSDQHIFAIGDCANRPMPFYGGRMRLESVPNALEQAKQAAWAICGKPEPAPEVPWFWSDQFDIRLQIAGLPVDAAQTVLRGSVDGGRFALFHLAKDNRVLSVEAVSFPQAMAIGKMLIGKRACVDPARIADETVALKELAR